MNLIIKIIVLLFGDLIVVLNGGIFKLKDKCAGHSVINIICKKAYERRLYKMGSYIGINSVLGKDMIFPHGVLGVFISNDAVVGDNSVIFHQVTIGSNLLYNHPKSGSPTIGNNCYIGAGAKIIGNIKIGNNVRIGANCVVTEDIPNDSSVVLDKPRIISKKNIDNRYFIKDNGEYFYYDKGTYKKV